MQEEKVRISQLLGVVKEEKLISRALEFGMSVSYFHIPLSHNLHALSYVTLFKNIFACFVYL